MNDNENTKPACYAPEEWINDFRERIKNIDARYKVCVTDVCFNILYPYCDCITYNGLFASIPEIGYRCIVGLFTTILLVDYKLVYGKKINTLVDSFVSKLYDFVHSKDAEVSYDDIKKKICMYTSIDFMLNKSGENFIDAKYISYSEFVKERNPVCLEPKKFNNLETEIIQAKLSLGCLSCSINSEIADIINKEASSLGFDYKIDDGDKSYISFVCDKTNVKAALVLQIVRKEEQIHMQPSIILANLDTSNCLELYKKIFSENVLKSLDFFAGTSIVANNLLYTVLCYNIVCIFHMQQFLDKQKVKADFGNNGFFNMVIDELFTIQKPFLSLDDVVKFTTGTLGSLSRSDSISDKNSDFPVKLQNVIFDIYKEQEKAAYSVLKGESRANKANRIHPNSYYDVINAGVNPSSKSEFAATFHELLRLRNLGIINLCFYNNDDYKNNCGVTVDDLAYLIKALRYLRSKYEPFFEHFVISYKAGIVEYWFKKIYADEIYSTDAEIKNELNETLSYIRDLFSIGHFWREYENINSYKFITADDSLRRKFPNKTDDDVIINEMIWRDICCRKYEEEFKQKIKQKELI